jgi:hypothetical protein
LASSATGSCETRPSRRTPARHSTRTSRLDRLRALSHRMRALWRWLGEGGGLEGGAAGARRAHLSGDGMGDGWRYRLRALSHHMRALEVACGMWVGFAACEPWRWMAGVAGSLRGITR